MTRVTIASVQAQLDRAESNAQHWEGAFNTLAKERLIDLDIINGLEDTANHLAEQVIALTETVGRLEVAHATEVELIALGKATVEARMKSNAPRTSTYVPGDMVPVKMPNKTQKGNVIVSNSLRIGEQLVELIGAHAEIRGQRLVVIDTKGVKRFDFGATAPNIAPRNIVKLGLGRIVETEQVETVPEAVTSDEPVIPQELMPVEPEGILEEA